MVRLFGHAPVIQSAIPAQDLQAMLDAHQQDGLTGAVEVERADGARFLLLFVEGMIPASYSLAAGIREIPPSELASLPAHETVAARTLTLPPEGVQAVRLLLQWHPPSAEAQSEPGAVRSQIAAWNAQPATSVVHIAWPDADGLAMLMGNAAPLEEAVFVTDTQVKSGADAIAAIYEHAAGPCTLARYTAPADQAAKREETIHLHKAFDSLVDAVTQRYAELVGSGLTEKLMTNLNTQAQASGWEIKIASTGVVDTHAFKDAESAAQAYRALLEEMVGHMASVIGKRLADLLVLEVVVQLSSDVQRTAQAYSLVPTQEMRRDLYKRSV